MVDVTLSGERYTNIEIEVEDGMHPDRAFQIAYHYMEGVIGDTIHEGPHPPWVQKNPMFDEADWTVKELERTIEEEIKKYCG